MSHTVWQTAGATLSLKNAIGEYGVTERDLREAKIEFKWRSFFGNSFPIFIRDDVVRVAREKNGSQHEVNEARKALRSVNSQLAGLDSQRATLAQQKQGLEQKLAGLGAAAQEPAPVKAAAGKGNKVAKPAGRVKKVPAAGAAAAPATAAPAAKRGRKRSGAESDEDWKP